MIKPGLGRFHLFCPKLPAVSIITKLPRSPTNAWLICYAVRVSGIIAQKRSLRSAVAFPTFLRNIIPYMVFWNTSAFAHTNDCWAKAFEHLWQLDTRIQCNTFLHVIEIVRLHQPSLRQTKYFVKIKTKIPKDDQLFITSVSLNIHRGHTLYLALITCTFIHLSYVQNGHWRSTLVFSPDIVYPTNVSRLLYSFRLVSIFTELTAAIIFHWWNSKIFFVPRYI